MVSKNQALELIRVWTATYFDTYFFGDLLYLPEFFDFEMNYANMGVEVAFLGKFSVTLVARVIQSLV